MLLTTQLAGGNALDIKSHNLSAILLALLRHQPISRVRLSRQIGLSTTTVTNMVTELVEQGVVREEGTDMLAVTSGAGRLPRALHLVPESRYALGIFIGVRRIRVVLGDLGARIVDMVVTPHQPGEAAADTVARITAAARGLLERNGLAGRSERVLGVGVGASGLVAGDTGVNLLAPSLSWRDVPLRAMLAAGLGLPVVVDNNVRTMALAESLYGAGQEASALIMVYGQVGVGAGVVIDGRVYRGASYGAGEIGHWTIIPDGELCRCGNRGCLETLVGEPAIVARARALRPELDLGDAAPLSAIFAAARGGDAVLRGMLEERAGYLGIALANLVNVLNPAVILLGGLFYEGFDLFQPEVERTMRQRSFAGLGQGVRLVPATFGQQSGEIGAVALALHSFFFQHHAEAQA